MSYETKDIDFLEQLFSEKALIIVGTVVKQLPQEGHYLPADQIRYNIKTKQQYLDRLRRIFKANKKIEIRGLYIGITRTKVLTEASHPTGNLWRFRSSGLLFGLVLGRGVFIPVMGFF